MESGTSLKQKKAALVLIAAAIAAALSISAMANFMSGGTSTGGAAATASSYKPMAREFWLFNDKVSGMNDTMVGLPGDKFSMPLISARQGDTIVIHFYNVEMPGVGDSHSFTIVDKPYDSVNMIVKPGANQTVTFKATEAGVFTYICTFHQPSMRGELVITA